MRRFVRLALVFLSAAVFAVGCSVNSESVSPKPVLAEQHGYPVVYRVKSILTQIEILKKSFPELDTHLFYVPPAVDEAEGRFVIPQWELLAPTYGKAVERVFGELAKQRPFHNWREDKLGPKYLRQTERTAAMWKRITAYQAEAPILLVSAQFGLRHRGKSVQEARASFAENEFGLGAYEVGIMLLTHPERLQSFNDLWIDVPGDEHSWNADGDFSYAPLFDFDGGKVRFHADWYGHAFERYGSASAFLSPGLPQFQRGE